jgi:hypothetical protein
MQDYFIVIHVDLSGSQSIPRRTSKETGELARFSVGLHGKLTTAKGPQSVASVGQVPRHMTL